MRQVASTLREEGLPVTRIFFMEWVNNLFPMRPEVEVLSLIRSRGHSPSSTRRWHRTLDARR